MKYSTAQSNRKSRKKCDEQPTVFVSAAFREQCLARLKGAPLSVYLAYCSHANKEGIAWPSLLSLARSTGYGINAVKRAKQTLIEMGLLVPIEQSREGGQFGRKKFRVNAVAPKQCHGTVAPSTVAPSTVAPKQCQEGSPSEGFPIEGDPANAVRHPIDAERLASVPSFKSASRFKKTQNLKAHLVAKIEKDGGSYAHWIEDCQKRGWEHPFGDEEREAFAATGYEPDLNDPLLGSDFVMTVVDVCEEKRGKDMSAGNLCSAIIDRCDKEIKQGFGTYYPPSFVEHRDQLRAKERATEQTSQT